MTADRRWRLVPEDLDGERVDRILAIVGDMSRSQARALISAGHVTVDEEVEAEPSRRVGTGARLTFVPPGPPLPLLAEEVPFGVLFEDDDLAVVDKPAGVVTHPGAGNAAGTLAAGLLHRWPAIEGVGELGRWGLVHRLDRGTSGLLVVAKTGEAWEALQAMIRSRDVSRTYLTLVQEPMAIETGTVDAPIDRDPHRPMRRRISPGGRQARTHYRQLAAWRDHALLEVQLETGRTHQIRVHLAAIDHPVVGDGTYGAGRDRVDPGRPWLHSWRLAFDHPFSGEKVDCIAPPPADLVAAVEALGEPERGTVFVLR